MSRISDDESVPADYESRIAELRVSGQRVGYLRAKSTEWIPRRKPSFVGIDLDVIIIHDNDSASELDFAIPDRDSFIDQAGTGNIHLNGTTYAIAWLDRVESVRVINAYF